MCGVFGSFLLIRSYRRVFSSSAGLYAGFPYNPGEFTHFLLHSGDAVAKLFLKMSAAGRLILVCGTYRAHRIY